MDNDRLPIDRIKNQTSLPPPTANTSAQERFPEAELAQIRKEVAQRLRQAFDHANNAEIARRCKTTDATIKLYTDGERLPIPEILLQIRRVTNINLHWLLTGEGSRYVEISNLFSPEEELRLKDLARQKKTTFNELVRKLAVSGSEFLENLE